VQSLGNLADRVAFGYLAAWMALALLVARQVLRQAR
jgi:hypothetical protein